MELVIKVCLVERDNIKSVDPAFTMGTETCPVPKTYCSIRNTRLQTESRNLAVLSSVPVFYYRTKHFRNYICSTMISFRKVKIGNKHHDNYDAFKKYKYCIYIYIYICVCINTYIHKLKKHIK